jgi:RHS repeat-associated protein
MVTSAGVQTYYRDGAIGSNVATTDASDNILSRTEYDAYGVAYNIVSGTPGPFRFVGNKGYFTDDETGMDLLSARYYLPVLGRFLTQDPSGQSAGVNLYQYCGNNPLANADPTGLEQIAIAKGDKYYDFLSQNIDKIGGTSSFSDFGTGLRSMLDAGQLFVETDIAKMSRTYADGVYGEAGGYALPNRIVFSIRYWLEEEANLGQRGTGYYGVQCQFQCTAVHEYQHELQYASGSTMSHKQKEIDACLVGERYADIHWHSEPDRLLKTEWIGPSYTQRVYRRRMGG